MIGALACSGGGNDEGVGGSQRTFSSMALARYPNYGGAPGTPESTCGPGYLDELAVDGMLLSFDACDFEPPNVYNVRQGERALTDGELRSVEQELARIVPGEADTMCGPDAGFVTLDVQHEAATERYISASGCGLRADGRTAASGLDNLWGTLSQLSRE